MGRIALLYRLIVRPLIRQPGRALLLLFAVALGDGGVVAIDLAGDGAAGPLHSSVRTLAGKDDFEVTAAGGVPEGIVARIATLPYALRVSPRIEDHAMVVTTGETVPLIGIDFVAEANGAGNLIGDATSRQRLPHIIYSDVILAAPGGV